jgi:hypothetical protein
MGERDLRAHSLAMKREEEIEVVYLRGDLVFDEAV